MRHRSLFCFESFGVWLIARISSVSGFFRTCSLQIFAPRSKSQGKSVLIDHTIQPATSEHQQFNMNIAVTPSTSNIDLVLPKGLTGEQYAKALEFAAASTVTPVKITPRSESLPLPPGLTQELYEQALDFVKLASKSYDWDDFLTVKIGFGLFSGVDDILEVDFRTPNYTKVRGGGNDIDIWGGDDRGLDFSLFEHKDTGDMVLAFRGTEPLSVEDWIEDIKQAFGSGKQYENAVELAKSLNKKAKKQKKTLRIAGHSLGGGLATAAALATGCEAIVINAAGVSEDTIQNLGLNVENEVNITNINVQECFVSDWNKKMDNTTIGSDALGVVSTQKQYGKTFWLKSVSDRADFKLLPDWTRTVKQAESVLNHAWHVVLYQLEHKNFVQPEDIHDGEEDSKDRRPTKKQKTKK